ncbi:MAG: peptidylprolyl isomerase [Acidobacteriaceae bacterium]
MKAWAGIRAMAAMIGLAGWGLCAQNPSPQAPPPAPSTPSADQPIELDHAVAIIGSNVLLQSDVEQEMHLSALEPLQVLPGQNTPSSALRRLIDRTLILQQMEQQQQPTTTPAPEVEKSLAELRRQIPACNKFHCETAEGWAAFLHANELSGAAVDQRWSQRMAILQFIDLRFRSGIRISQEQIATYYQKTLAPALAKDNQKAPPLVDVSARIQEVLLEQQVSGMLQDWLSSLRDQGNVRIVDQAYSADFDSGPAAGNQ